MAWGRCTELDGVPPFWAWREMFTALTVAAPVAGAGRAGVLTALLDRIDALTTERPLLLCVEDLHRADADTRWLLRGLIDATAGRPLAVVASWHTAEPGDQLAGLPPRVYRLPLPPLQAVDSVALARQVADGALSDDVLARAAGQWGGNPFFVRELVRMQLLGAAERVPRGCVRW